jgi:hypothetical protein
MSAEPLGDHGCHAENTVLAADPVDYRPMANITFTIEAIKDNEPVICTWSQSSGFVVPDVMREWIDGALADEKSIHAIPAGPFFKGERDRPRSGLCDRMVSAPRCRGPDCPIQREPPEDQRFNSRRCALVGADNMAPHDHRAELPLSA